VSEFDVSVIIPTYRRERELVEAISSALSQEGVSIEVLVLDDTSEGTAERAVHILGDPRVQYIKRPAPSRGKPALVRNEAIGRARGRYLYFLDDDDHVLPGALQALSTGLESDRNAAVAYGTVQPFGENPEIATRYTEWFGWAARTSRYLGRSSWLAVGTILFRGTLIINSVCMMRRECAIALGGYDASIPVYEDVDFHMRGMRRWGHVFVDHPVLHYRTGAPSLMHDHHGNQEPIQQSYRIMHRKYKETYGLADYRALQIMCKLLPLRVPSQGQANVLCQADQCSSQRKRFHAG
jgi:glycosyltransferase involved in cell wall biosynthesis